MCDYDCHLKQITTSPTIQLSQCLLDNQHFLVGYADLQNVRSLGSTRPQNRALTPPNEFEMHSRHIFGAGIWRERIDHIRHIQTLVNHVEKSPTSGISGSEGTHMRDHASLFKIDPVSASCVMGRSYVSLRDYPSSLCPQEV